MNQLPGRGQYRQPQSAHERGRMVSQALSQTLDRSLAGPAGALGDTEDPAHVGVVEVVQVAEQDGFPFRFGEPGENVLDLFGGSGSTLIGAEMTGRKAFLMEIDPLYCDVIRKRWAEFVHGEGCEWAALTAPVGA